MMNFLRHLLSHIMFLVLVLGVVAIYYFRSQVMPVEYVEKIEHYAVKIHPALVAFKNTEKEVRVARVQVPALPKIMKENQADNEAKVTEQVVEKVIVIAEETQEIEAEPVVEKVEVIEKKTDIIVKENVISTPVVAAVKIEQEVNKEWLADVPTAEVVEKINPVIVVAPAKEKEVIETVQDVVEKSSDAAVADYKHMLQTARALFQRKKYKESISKYKELIELESHEADFYGELGNVYYGAGNWNMAGASYYEAAIRLMDKGDFSQVSYLQRVLQGLDKDRAYKLAQKISAKRQMQ